tara:strand:+ start:678 stop:839 length:162 start_codon:yes stop_codon:yes gene_type:complete
MRFTRQQTKHIERMLKREHERGLVWGIIISMASAVLLTIAYLSLIKHFPNTFI